MTQALDAQVSGGPYLQVACLCETVVQRRDNVLTLVNIIDRISVTLQGQGAPETMPTMPFRANLVMILKAGRARGRHELRIVLELPDGGSKEPVISSLNFEGEDDRGVQLVSPLIMTLTHEGLHWFAVYLDGRLLTRLPLRVVYARITGPTRFPEPPG